MPFPTVLVQNNYCTHTLTSVQTWVENLIGGLFVLIASVFGIEMWH